MLKEITSVEEMAALPSGTHVLNKYRLPGFVRAKYGRPDDDWKETIFRLRIKGGVPHLLGKYGTYHKVREQDFTDDDRYFVEVRDER